MTNYVVKCGVWGSYSKSTGNDLYSVCDDKNKIYLPLNTLIRQGLNKN